MTSLSLIYTVGVERTTRGVHRSNSLTAPFQVVDALLVSLSGFQLD